VTSGAVTAEWIVRRVALRESAGFSIVETIGPSAGPTLAVLAGVHGDEPTGVAAAHLVRDALPPLARGRVRLVPVCNEPAWRAAQRATPADGQDLARSFPGGGGATGELASRLAKDVIADADALIDLHTAPPLNDMAFLVGFVDHLSHSPRSRQLADAFGAEVMWIHDHEAPGRTMSVAAERGIPAIYTEGSGGGAVDSELAARYARGVASVAAKLGLVTPELTVDIDRPTMVRGDGDLDHVGVRAEADGLLLRCAEPGSFVHEGEALARVVDPIHAHTTKVASDRDGVIVLIARERSVREGDQVAVVAPLA
jgi:predicted deacylase